MEFPPVAKEGAQFINSTPRLFSPLKDYACINRLYYADFGGTDDDGDSLVYSLVTPYSTVDTQNPLPAVPNPGPYPEVVWKDGYNLTHIMDADPDLAISQDGILTVKPLAVQGLYVFAVKVEEFRNGEKHGEMRRDFQILVVDCEENAGPVVIAREQGETEDYEEGNVLNFSYEDPDKCMDILVTDQLIDGQTESEINVRAIPIDFDAGLEGIEIDVSENIMIENESDTARFSICFPDCPLTRSGSYKIGIIAEDNACPQPALDTVVVIIHVPPPPNQNAYYKVNAVNQSGAAQLGPVIYSDGGSTSWSLGAFDNDNDELQLQIEPIGFELEDIGVSFSDIDYVPGSATTVLSWSYDCNAQDMDFSAGRDLPVGKGVRRAFDVLFTAEDIDNCEWQDPQTLLVTLVIDFPDQTKPQIFEAGNPNTDYLYESYQLLQTARHSIRGTDEDGDEVRLTAHGINFNLTDVNAQFPAVQGPQPLAQEFLWQIPCNIDLAQQDKYTIEFYVEDIDACQLTNTDTLLVDFVLNPPPANRPQIDFLSNNTVDIINDSIGIILGNTVDLDVIGRDIDGDVLTLSLVGPAEAVQGLTFSNAEGSSRVSSQLLWQPDCSIFTDENYEESFLLNFLVQDDNCYQPQDQLASLTLYVRDKDAQAGDFLPPNFFSPNGDEYNEFFGMYKRNDTGDLISILPIDNCAGIFEEVEIFNRWGKPVFNSTDRDFKWYGGSYPPGVYYYHIQYSNRDFKGAVSMLK